MNEPIPFIVGCGRSGTTLLRSILDSHPDMAIPGENDFLLSEFKHGTPFTRGEPVALAQIDAWLEQYPTLRSTLAVSPEDAPEQLTLPEWFQRSYRAYAARFGKTRFGDKTPGLVHSVKALAAAIPDAVFIHLIRDGRDVAEAFVAQDWGPRTIGEAARTWRRHVSAGRAGALRLPHHRYLELRYEDLVADVEASVRQVCDFLALEYDPVMLEFQESAARARSLTRFPEAHRRLDRALTPGLRDWRRDMSLARRLRFEAVGGGLLEACGYDPPLSQVVRRRLRNSPPAKWTRKLVRRKRSRAPERLPGDR